MKNITMRSKRNSVPDEELGIETSTIFDRGGWVQISANLDLIKCICWDKWENFELIFCYGKVSSDLHRHTREQFTFGLDYFITNKSVVKLAYDINNGRENSNNRFTIQLAYGY